MSLSEFEIGKITEIVAGRVGTKLDAKELRRVIDSVVDSLKAQQGNPEITGATCEVSASPTSSSPSSPTTPPAQNTTTPSELNEKAGLYEQIEKTDKTRIIIAAFGKDRPGIVAAIANVLSELNCSIEDISQTIMQEFFSMIMIVNIGGCPVDFSALRDRLKATEAQLGMQVYVMHEDIFRYMHRI